MSQSRLEILLGYYRTEPHDPFNLYALALEYSKHDLEKARQFFDLLLTDHPDYLPTYYHAARFYSELGDRDKAIIVYEKGIDLATKLKEQKTLRELRSAYEEMLF